MRNGLNKYDKYLGERVKITDKLGDTFHMKVMSSGEFYIQGFDDERMNRVIQILSIENIEVVKK